MDLKAELVSGILVGVDDDMVQLEVDGQIQTYPTHGDLDEDWVADQLGEEVKASVIDGRIRNIRSA